MNITQTFYDNMASQYDKRFQDWQAATREQVVIPDCACGTGTQQAPGRGF